VKNIIVDAGPLIALFDKDDKYHTSVINFLKEFNGNLITTWPVITEVSHLLSFNINVQIDFLEWLKREAVKIVNLEFEHLDRIIQLTKKYSDMPMDLADSSLIVIAELTGINDIISIDNDYYIYRTKTKKALNNLLLSYIKKKH
jgi:predicted nucleic acid-binding protein